MVNCRENRLIKEKNVEYICKLSDKNINCKMISLICRGTDNIILIVFGMTIEKGARQMPENRVVTK